MIKAAIFDMDGTLLDSMPFWKSAPARFLKRHGIIAEPGIEKVTFNMTLDEASDYVRTMYHLPMTVPEISHETDLMAREYYNSEAALKEDVVCFLEILKKKGLKMAVGTVTDRVCVEAALTRLRIIDYFEGIVTASEAGRGKRFPDIFLNCARMLSSSPEETIVFEDSLTAVRTANEAGFITAGIFDNCNDYLADDLKKESRYFIPDFRLAPKILSGLLKPDQA